MLLLAASGFVASLLDRLACLDLLEPRFLARNMLSLGRHRVACSNVVVVNTTMVDAVALLAAVTALAAAALAAAALAAAALVLQA